MKYFFIFHKICDDEDTFETVSYSEFELFCSKAYEFNCRSTVSEIVLTFDDGLASDLTARKVAASHGLETIHFIVPSLINSDGYLSIENIKFLVSSGAKIGSHSYKHVNLNLLSSSDLTDDLNLSKAWFHQMLGFQPSDISLPYGKATRKVLKQVSRYYKNIYTSGIYNKEVNTTPRYGINKNNISSDLEFLIKDYNSSARKIRYFLKEIFIGVFGDSFYFSIRKVVSVLEKNNS